MKRLALLFAGLLLFGAVKLPLERALTRDLEGAHFLSSQLNRDVREQAGQMGFVAALSGFRAIVADFLWIRAYTAWEQTEWGRLKLLLDTVTSLQPRATLFWDNAAWHMAWNAAINARERADIPREALRLRAEKEYVKVGEDFLLRGIGYNPDKAVLFERLGMLYSERMKDPCKSSWAYFEAAKRPDAMQYVHRFAIYQLAKCPGHEAEALRLLKELYFKGERERLPTLLTLIQKLEKDLNVPEAERTDVAADLKAATPHRFQPPPGAAPASTPP